MRRRERASSVAAALSLEVNEGVITTGLREIGERQAGGIPKYLEVIPEEED